MFSLVVVITVLNLLIGFGLALGLELLELRRMTVAAVVPVAPVAEPPPASPTSAPGDSPACSAPASVERVPFTTPAAWQATIANAVEVPTSFVEATVHFFRTALTPYRGSLVTLSDRIADRLSGKSDDTLANLVEEARATNVEWLKRQTEAMAEFASRRGEFGHLEAIGSELEEVLMHQAAQIETALGNMDGIYLEPDQSVAIGKLSQEVSRLASMANLLETRMTEGLAAILRLERRLQAIGPTTGHCPLTGLMNRIGAEAAFEDWRREDLGRKRNASYALMDVDMCSRLNDSAGPRVVDQILLAFCKLIATECEASEQKIRISRMSGQSILTFMPDMTLEQGATFIEQLRKKIDSTSHTAENRDQRVTISCSVTALEKQESFADVSGRLYRGMKEAKKAGRNCTAKLEAMRSKAEIIPA